MRSLSGKKVTIVVLAIIAVGIIWVLFRPDLLFIDKTVSEDSPVVDVGMPSEVALLYEGKFRGIAHETVGSAMIYQYPNGSRILRLMDFETSNGPDVHVYLVAAADAPDDETVKDSETIDLGSMKGNIGNQNYDLPEGLDLEKYRSVTIWCKRFGVNFGTAALALPD